jgi:hypothetical protein
LRLPINVESSQPPNHRHPPYRSAIATFRRPWCRTVNAIERTRMLLELVLIRSELKYRSCQLIKESSLNVWRIKQSGEKLPIWLEFSQGSW